MLAVAGKLDAVGNPAAVYGATTLNAANMIVNLGAFTTNNGAFSLTDARSLTTIGTVNAGSGAISLKTTGASTNDIAIHSHLIDSMSTGTITLVSAGNLTETSAGAIITDLLNVTADTGISLTSTANQITTLGTDHTNSGPNNVHL